MDEEESKVALKLTTREVDGVTVVALDGRIVLGEESSALREKVKSLVAEGKKKIVLNMDNITFIDSAGLGTLVASHHKRKKPGRIAPSLPPGRQIYGSPANHEADDYLRCLQHRSRSSRQLLQVSSHRLLDLPGILKRAGSRLSFLFSNPRRGTS